MTVQLPPMPKRVARLPRDKRGYPIPWFIEWVRQGEHGPEPAPIGAPDAEPDFRMMNEMRRRKATRVGLCWVCGEQLGSIRVFVIGPMCVVNRVTSEPPSHRDCAEFAVKACPFLLRPRMKRLPTDDIPEKVNPGGVMLDRNPGCMALYQALKYRPFETGVRDRSGDHGWLIRLGPPQRIDWWAEGRQATRAEVMASIDSGYPFLWKMAKEEGREAMVDLERMRAAAMQLVPAA